MQVETMKSSKFDTRLLILLLIAAVNLGKATAVSTSNAEHPRQIAKGVWTGVLSSSPENTNSSTGQPPSNVSTPQMTNRAVGAKSDDGRLNIHVKTDSVEYSGKDVHVIRDVEVTSFGLTDSALKNAVQSFTGQRPDDAYIRSPTPWGDLYQRYGWKQVHTTFRPHNAEILGYKADPVILSEREFVNNSSVKVTYNTAITQEVAETVSNRWTKSLEVSVEQEISYSLEIFGTGIEGATTFSVTGNWGKEYEESKTITVGSSTGVEVELEPGQGVVAILSASRGSRSVRVDYKATVDGDMAMNYANKYNGHYFWKADINDVQSFMGSTKEVDSSEVITYGFYSNARVEVRDLVTKKMVAQFYAQVSAKP